MPRISLILVEEASTGRVRHELHTEDPRIATVLEVVRENGSLSFLEPLSEIRSTAHALLHISLPAVKLTALDDDAIIRPGNLGQMPYDEATYHTLRIGRGDKVYLRPDDCVVLGMNSPSEVRFTLKLPSPEPDVQVGSSIPPIASTPPNAQAAMAETRDNPNASHASVEVSMSTLEDGPTGTPQAAKLRNIVQETPTTGHKSYDALAKVDVPQSPSESQFQDNSESSRNDTQIKAEEESQLASRQIPSSPPDRMPTALPPKAETPPVITDSFTGDPHQMDDNSSAPHSNIETTERDILDTHIERAIDQADLERSISLGTQKDGQSEHVNSEEAPLPITQSGSDDETDSEEELKNQGDEQDQSQRSLSLNEQLIYSNTPARDADPIHEVEDTQPGANTTIESTDSGQIQTTKQTPRLTGSNIQNDRFPEIATSRLDIPERTNLVPQPIKASTSSPIAKKRKRLADADEVVANPKLKKVKGHAMDSGGGSSHAQQKTPGGKISVVIPTPAKSIKPSPATQASKERSGSTFGSKRKATAGVSSRSSITLGSPIPSIPSPTLGRRGRSASISTTPSSSPTPIPGKRIRVIFSNSTIPQKTMIMKFFKDHGGKTVEKATQESFDVLVVGNGELKKTSKFLLSIALGKHIVTDAWLAQSAKEGKFLDIMDYVPEDPFREKAWGISLKDVMGKSRRGLFTGRTIVVTPALKKEYGSSGYSEIEELAKVAGAKNLISKKGIKDVESGAVVLTCERDDADAAGMMESGVICYNKELLSLSILRGKLDLESDEFKIAGSTSPERKKRGRPRKSG